MFPFLGEGDFLFRLLRHLATFHGRWRIWERTLWVILADSTDEFKSGHYDCYWKGFTVLLSFTDNLVKEVV